MNETPDPKLPEAPQIRLSDAEWAEIEARHIDEEKRLEGYDGRLQVRIEGDPREYSAGEQIRLKPDQVGAAATVTDEHRRPLAAFLVPETYGKGAVDLVHPGPLRLTFSLRGKAATLHREITTADLSLLDIAHWIRCHWQIGLVLALTWMIIGVQVTLVEIVRGSFQGGDSFGNTAYDSALNAYLLGTIPGALLFGWLADRIGRQHVYRIAALIYLATTVATALLLSVPHDGDVHRAALTAFRFLAGFGIGGEYVFLYTAVQELMPKKRRGWACLAISGAFWLGFFIAALVGAFLAHYHWHHTFFFIIVGIMGLAILRLRTFLPESPRWLVAQGRRNRRAEQMLEEIRADLESRPAHPSLTTCQLLVPARVPAWWKVPVIMGHKYPRQTLVGLALLCTQAFFYNVFFFSFGPMLETFFGSRANGLELKLEYYIYITIANFAGPILLGRFFDTAGRKTMIVLTYIASALAILGAAILLQVGFLASPLSMTLAWFVIFFFASTAASAAYLTAGESFPSEIRALAFAILFGLSMASGVLGWFIYGILIKDLQPESAVSLFCLLAAGVMAVAALVEGLFGIEYAGESLDRYSPPLSRVVKDGAVS